MQKVGSDFKRVRDTLFGRIKAKRSLKVYPDDIFLVDYSGSGSDQGGPMVFALLYPDDPMTLEGIARRIGAIYLQPDRELRRLPRPRLIGSHECFDPRYRKVIYFVRDPREVALIRHSLALEWGDIPQHLELDEFVLRFIAGEYDSPYGSACWGDHVLSWLATRERQNGFLLVRVEDLEEDPDRELTRICSLLDIDVNPQRLSRVKELASLDQLRSLQTTSKWKPSRMKTRYQRQFLAGGTPSVSWKAVLSEKSTLAIESAWGFVMQRLGYELVSASLTVP